MKEQSQEFAKDKYLAGRYGVARATIWRWVRDGQFPKPKKIGPGCTRWAMQEIYKWEEGLGD